MGVGKGKYNRQKWKSFLDEAGKRTENEKDYKNYEDSFLAFMREYEEKKKDDLEASLKYYKDATTTDFFNSHYISLNEKHIKFALARCKVMIITANPIEKAVLHHKIVDYGSIIMTRILCETTAYYIFKWGKYWVAHIHQSQTGAWKDMGTNFTIGDALKLFTPNVIISLGIAFGIDYNTQNIGDVLVSRRLFPYSENKRDEDYVKPDRTQDKTIDDWLHVRLENAIGFLDGVTYGDILSGGSVMSSFKEKDRICLGYTKADYIIGGEMEGNAVFQYAKKVDIPGVVIKGICDWGVAKNGIFPNDPEREDLFKDSLQAFAMKKAVKKCKALFNDKEIFSTPKNITLKKLREKYFFCKWGLIVSQLIMVTNGIYILWCRWNYRIGKSIDVRDEFFDNPMVWLALPLIFMMTFLLKILIDAIPKLLWRLRACLKRYL